MTHETEGSDEKALAFFGEAGFEFWDTGGGCTAFGRRINDFDPDSPYILVTAAEDAYHPHDNDKKVAVGYYDDEGNYAGDTVECESWEEAVKAVNALIKKHDV